MKRKLNAEPVKVVFTRAWTPLSKEQIAKILAEWPQTDVRWRALWDWLGEEYEAEMLSLIGGVQGHEELLVWKGRIQMLMLLRANMLEMQRGQEPAGE